MTTYEDVEDVSERLMRTLDVLKKEGYSPKALGIGMIDACVKLSRLSRADYNSPTYEILRNIAALMLDMAKDEEAELKKGPTLQ